jgi:hypothetical protein
MSVARAKIGESILALTAAILLSAGPLQLAAYGPASDQDASEGRGVPAPVEQPLPAPVEQALIEHRCSATRATSPADTGAYAACLDTQLRAIRADFGRDLGNLSPVERRTVDAVCSRVRAAEGRDAYLGCLDGQLASLRNRRNPTAAAPSRSIVPARAAGVTPADSISAPPQAASGRSAFLWIGIATLALGGTTGALLVRKKLQAATRCRVCDVVVPGGGDLCQTCRHEAAEAVRRASVERARHEAGQRRR